nr:integrase, catalytic region, zinc finger, CCHC-type, peptidase aspartic, catalytic [Tanacetum cinerariifolium]
MDSIIPFGQKNTLAEYMILSGANNRQPMLDKDLYDSWKSRMELYMQNREHERMILESAEHGLLIWTTIKENGVTRTKKYAKLSAAEKIQAGLTVPVFSLGDDPISCLNKAMASLTVIASSSSGGNNASGHATFVKCYNCQGEGHMARQCTQPKRSRSLAWYKDKAMLAEAQEVGQIVDEEQLIFLADPEAVLMANISNYGSDVILEDFEKCFVPQQELLADEAFLYHMLNPSTKSSDTLLVKIEAPEELPMVILVNKSLKKLKLHLSNFDKVVKIRTTPNARTEGMFKLDLDPLAPKLVKNREAHIDYLKYTQEQADILRGIVKQAKAKQPLDNALHFTCSSKKAKIVESKNVNHSEPNNAWGFNAIDISPSSSLVMIGTVRFENDHIARIIGYGNYQLGNVTISRVYYVERLGHKLFSVGQFCDADREVAFKKNTCFIHIRRLRAGYGTVGYHILTLVLFKLAKEGLARGTPRLKFQKDHLYSACVLGKSKKSSHQPKAKDTNQEKLYLLHMDLCGLMRVASIDGKMYILFKKPASPQLFIILVSFEEPTKKSKRVKRSAKKSTMAPAGGVVIRETPEMPLSKKKEKSLRDFHKTHPSGSGTVTKTAPSAAKIKPSVTNKGTGVKPGVLDVIKEESSESEAESWGNNEYDNNNEQDSISEGSDEENDNDDKNTQSDNVKGSNSEHETDKNESD